MLATVTDPRGHVLVDIGPDDFVVQEGGTSREILSVRVADYPIVLLLDMNLASPEDQELMRRAAAHFIERLGNDRPAIAGTIAAVPRLLTTFDDDRKTVLDRINALTMDRAPDAAASDAGPRAPSRVSDLLRAAGLAANTLHATGSLFSSIVILSAAAADGGDTPPEALASIIDSGAIVHVVAEQTAASADRVPAALRTIVNQTRGEFTPIYSAASYQAALDRLVDRMASEILIEYIVPPGSRPVDAKVGVRLPGARVRGLGVAPK